MRGGTPNKGKGPPGRWKTAFYVDEICNDKEKILRKLRKIGYNYYFANNFQVARIDKNFKDLENKEKALEEI